ncbi:MAG: hypothetical protein DMG76_28045 [Acidobacteria bacterium]|nr:MAG: hypothetical protein DMG76_28045 [Acidobacteriota bacterium]
MGVTDDIVLTAKYIFELANQAYSLYLTRNHAERAQLLKRVLLNCDTDGVSLWPIYRYPYDLISERAKNQEWSGREDLNLRPPGPELGGAELILLIFNHLSGASTVSVLLDHPSLGVM